MFNALTTRTNKLEYATMYQLKYLYTNITIVKYIYILMLIVYLFFFRRIQPFAIESFRGSDGLSESVSLRLQCIIYNLVQFTFVHSC